MAESPSSVEKLEERLSEKWLALTAARELSRTTREQLDSALHQAPNPGADVSVVLSGSLARDEFTCGSDVDWTLLIDGATDPNHQTLLFATTDAIDEAIKPPKQVGPEQTFGTMVFSHNLIHEIGGEDDTNSNTTRRLLLLLESRPVGPDDAYNRVVRSLLDRYLLEDRGFWRSSDYRVPRFLQNDFSRYWRTVAVDFAYKLRTRSSREWAIRNIKLRMSRKLLYVSGLLGCFSCYFDFSKNQWTSLSQEHHREEVIEHLEKVFGRTPLELLAHFLLSQPHLDNTARKIFSSYDRFIGVLADSEKRTHLDKLPEEQADNDEVYQAARQDSHDFRDGLLELFFDQNSGLEKLTKTYGVF